MSESGISTTCLYCRLGILTLGGFAPKGCWKCLETFLVATLGMECYWHLVGRDVKHPIQGQPF